MLGTSLYPRGEIQICRYGGRSQRKPEHPPAVAAAHAVRQASTPRRAADGELRLADRMCRNARKSGRVMEAAATDSAAEAQTAHDT